MVTVMSKEERAEWFKGKLLAQGIASYGLASHIAKAIGCSNAVAQGWIRGSLPSDLTLAVKAKWVFQFSVEEWVTGIPVTGNNPDYNTAILNAKEFERSYLEQSSQQLSDNQFLMVVNLLLEHQRAFGSALSPLLEITKIISIKEGEK